MHFNEIKRANEHVFLLRLDSSRILLFFFFFLVLLKSGHINHLQFVEPFPSLNHHGQDRRYLGPVTYTQ